MFAFAFDMRDFRKGFLLRLHFPASMAVIALPKLVSNHIKFTAIHFSAGPFNKRI